MDLVSILSFVQLRCPCLQTVLSLRAASRDFWASRCEGAECVLIIVSKSSLSRQMLNFLINKMEGLRLRCKANAFVCLMMCTLRHKRCKLSHANSIGRLRLSWIIGDLLNECQSGYKLSVKDWDSFRLLGPDDTYI
jgi:hypothetical protein